MSIWIVCGVMAASLLTSSLSGVLGMGGGMILMGVLAQLLPVTSAMVLHGSAQLAANGSRAGLHWRHIHWPILPAYLAGSAAGVTLLVATRFTTEPWIIFLFLGLLPFVKLVLPTSVKLDITSRPQAVLCGCLVTIVQIVAGASGPVLDVFFLSKSLRKHEIVATKAMTQSFGHLTKLLYYLALGGTLGEGSQATVAELNLLGGTLLAACVGTVVGARVLDKMSDASFQKVSQLIVLVIGAVYLGKGVMALR